MKVIWNLIGLVFFFLIAHNYEQRPFTVSPLAGDIQIGMEDKKGQLEVEVIRARSLTQKPGSKSTPGKENMPYLPYFVRRLVSRQKPQPSATLDFYMLDFISSQ